MASSGFSTVRSNVTMPPKSEASKTIPPRGNSPDELVNIYPVGEFFDFGNNECICYVSDQLDQS